MTSVDYSLLLLIVKTACDWPAPSWIVGLPSLPARADSIVTFTMFNNRGSLLSRPDPILTGRDVGESVNNHLFNRYCAPVS